MRAYRVIFMERDLDEMLFSQDEMLARLNKPYGPPRHHERVSVNTSGKVRTWVAGQPNIEVLFVSYNDLLEQLPAARSRTGKKHFLGDKADAGCMSKTVNHRFTGTGRLRAIVAHNAKLARRRAAGSARNH